MALPDGEAIPTPDVPDWLHWVWRAWHRLSLDRPYIAGGMGAPVPGRIPWSAVRDWCDFHDLPGDAVPFLDQCVAAMDTEFIGYQVAAANEKPPPWRKDSD